MSIELDHPCKQTCSGWKQGFEKGVKEGLERAARHFDRLAHETTVNNMRTAAVWASYEIRTQLTGEEQKDG